LLISVLMKSVQTEILEISEDNHKKLSAKAKNILLNHDWPGNIRELQNTLARAVLWSDGTTITDNDVQEAVLIGQSSASPDLLALPLNEGFDLPDLLETIESHYIRRALEESPGNKATATKKLGLKNSQTLTNKMNKYGIE